MVNVRLAKPARARRPRPLLVALALAAAPAARAAPPPDLAEGEGLEPPRSAVPLESARAAASGEASSPDLPEAPAARLHLWGYGEVYYTRPTRRPQDSQADLARAVFGIGYAFSERTTFNSEYEVEHAVASSSDVGEFEVEQFYVEHEWAPYAILRGGLILMPFGLLNEHHEPTHFYGVQRNFVETLIIPSTWREGGVELAGHTDLGLSFAAGVTTGFDLSKWSYDSPYPPYHTALALEDSGVAPLQATHQELALANAEQLSVHLALDYQGLPGLLLGGAAFYGGAVKAPAAPDEPIPGHEEVLLYEGHARYTGLGLDVSALYAEGAISDTAAANAGHPGSVNPIPARFYGAFLQVAYAEGVGGSSWRLVPFARLEHYDLGSHYEGTSGPNLPTGLVPLSAAPGDTGLWPTPHDTVATLGVNLALGANVVVKADYQTFDANQDFRRFDLGLGLSFE